MFFITDTCDNLYLTLKMLITAAADDIFVYLFHFLFYYYYFFRDNKA